MPSGMQRMSEAGERRRRATAFGVGVGLSLAALGGCAHVENHWREDGPSRTAAWDSATAVELRERYPAVTVRERGWPASRLVATSGAVTHWPTYFEDPFVDKGAGNGRFDEFGTGEDAYRIGWEDYLAMPYGFARHTLNWLLAPVSAVVTPPWTLMESDGRVSRQVLGYDHDATRAGAAAPRRRRGRGEPAVSTSPP